MRINTDIETLGKDNLQIFHGDALEVLQAIPDSSVDLIFVDPPYNIGKDFAGRKISGKLMTTIWNGVISGLTCASKLKPTGAFYVMTSTQFMPYFDLYIRERMTICQELYGLMIVQGFRQNAISVLSMSQYYSALKIKQLHV